MCLPHQFLNALLTALPFEELRPLVDTLRTFDWAKHLYTLLRVVSLPDFTVRLVTFVLLKA